MWLLDVNVDASLSKILAGLGIDNDLTINRGWRSLSNGNLVQAAVEAGFNCLVTRDLDFGKSAAKALKHNPSFAVVVLAIPQARRKEWLEAFELEWKKNPIAPKEGRLIIWPSLPKDF